jgi:hypothetical protein
MFILQILIVFHNLHEYLDKIINCSNIETNTLVARLLKPIVVDCFGEIARWHLSKLRLGKILHMAQRINIS